MNCKIINPLVIISVVSLAGCNFNISEQTDYSEKGETNYGTTLYEKIDAKDVSEC